MLLVLLGVLVRPLYNNLYRGGRRESKTTNVGGGRGEGGGQVLGDRDLDGGEDRGEGEEPKGGACDETFHGDHGEDMLRTVERGNGSLEGRWRDLYSASPANTQRYSNSILSSIPTLLVLDFVRAPFDSVLREKPYPKSSTILRLSFLAWSKEAFREAYCHVVDLSKLILGC